MKSDVDEMIEVAIKFDINRAFMMYRRYLNLYQLWFAMFWDSDSDDIVSDIHEQAKSWAYAYMEASPA
jgi:hypothetical protein